ncbi:helix-turn-helix domain-containing protein [Erwinia persicina]|uniref:helix-turn-helix domain-containing protein n=1 Tax=Erwinia persicina TaxID=55211 RepID=UPI001780BE35|nr:helix-turn-helix domain-containing protein [Erwinia persicina]MBD8163568.1 helix-turn-helix domain-containing protein [Erwinia persicina]
MTGKVNISTYSGADVKSVSHALAARIKNFRKLQKFTLDELSRRAGVSKGMLVEIEKGTANPSIAILCKISAAMGVSVADIVDVAGKPAVHLVKQDEIPVLWRGDRGGTARLLAGTSGPDMVELWRWEMYPGELFSSPGHPAGTFELFHVEEGTLTLQVDGTELRIEKGCAAVARTDAPHHYTNAGNTTLMFTMTVAERQK